MRIPSFVVLLLVVAACSSPSDPSSAPDADAGVDIDSGAGDPGEDAPPAATCAGKTAQPVDATWTVMVGGVARTANVHVPASYDPARATPVVLNIHGRTGSAAGMATLTKAIAKSDTEGFILVHPQSGTTPTAWNSGTCCDPATTNNVDDVGFFGALLDELEEKLCVDTDRVFAMGMSNGGYMSHTLACKMTDRIAAIGPVSALLLQTPCTPSRPVPVMMINGTADSLSQYQFVGQGVTFWSNKNQCTTESQTFQNGDTTCVTKGGCASGADVTLCTVTDGGHQWPGGDALPFLGKKTDAIIATDAVWEFFVAHPRAM